MLPAVVQVWVHLKRIRPRRGRCALLHQVLDVAHVPAQGVLHDDPQHVVVEHRNVRVPTQAGMLPHAQRQVPLQHLLQHNLRQLRAVLGLPPRPRRDKAQGLDRARRTQLLLVLLEARQGRNDVERDHQRPRREPPVGPLVEHPHELRHRLGLGDDVGIVLAGPREVPQGVQHAEGGKEDAGPLLPVERKPQDLDDGGKHGHGAPRAPVARGDDAGEVRDGHGGARVARLVLDVAPLEVQHCHQRVLHKLLLPQHLGRLLGPREAVDRPHSHVP
mmetsp:Transcript_44781/g.112312  ORF Transcript_44781/g.112312 Transcript_44781/m.112312 type:complete len:274 (-) Transcript_44781:527-1348(-)